MALQFGGRSVNLTRIFVSYLATGRSQRINRSGTACRYSSKSGVDNHGSSLTKDSVVITDDGSTVVCWHPEPSFPYECSRPLPTVAPDTHSVLKVQHKDAVDEVFRPKPEPLVRQELMQLTHTTKHRWFPLKRKRYWHVKKTPRDREYL